MRAEVPSRRIRALSVHIDSDQLPGYQAPATPMHILYVPERRLTPKLRSFLDFAIASFKY